MLYLWLRRLHLYLMLISGLFIISLCLSGLLLVYADAIQKVLWPEQWTTQTHRDSQISHKHLAHNDLLQLSQRFKKSEQAAGSRITLLNLQETHHDIWQVGLESGRYANINPYTGECLKHYNYDDTLYGFLLSWHRRLLLNSSNANISQNILSIATTMLCINLCVGVWLWARPKRRLKRLRYRPSNSIKSKVGQLHALLGLYTFVPIFLIGFSGISFFWQAPTKTIINTLAAGTVLQPQHPTAQTVGESNLMQILQQAKTAFPEGMPKRIYFAKKEGDPIKVRIQQPGENHPYTWLWLEPKDSSVIASFDATKQSMASKIWNFRYKFHVGQWWNTTVKIIWLLLMLLPIFWVVSGSWLALKRRRPKPRTAVRVR